MDLPLLSFVTWQWTFSWKLVQSPWRALWVFTWKKALGQTLYATRCHSTGLYYFQDRIYETGCSRLKLLYANIFCIVLSFLIRALMSFLPRFTAQKFGAWSRVTKGQAPPPIPKTTSPPDDSFQQDELLWRCNARADHKNAIIWLTIHPRSFGTAARGLRTARRTCPSCSSPSAGSSSAMAPEYD